MKQMPGTTIRFLKKKFPSSLNGLHHYQRQSRNTLNQVGFRLGLPDGRYFIATAAEAGMKPIF